MIVKISKNTHPIILIFSLLLLTLSLILPCNSNANPLITTGDINNNGLVNLEDTIIVLQVCAGISPSGTVYNEADVNGDSKIGLPEAIYALQWAAGFYNSAPILEPIGNKSVGESELLSFPVAGTDSDGDDLTIMASNLPSGATFDSNTSVFSWTPTYSQSGTYNVTFTVTDGMGESDSETITITVNDKTPVFNAVEYFPLNVGDWWKYKIDGSIEQTKISEIKSISAVEGTVDTRIMLYADGSEEYYTSDSNGVQLYGGYVDMPPYYAGDVCFDTPLLYMPDNSQIDTRQVSTTTYSFTINIPDYGNVLVNVDLTSTTIVLGLEDLTTEHTNLKDCIKVSTQITQYVYAEGETATVTGDTIYYWFYKGVGCVKELSGSDTYIITESYVNGINKTY